jgi:hypothetical protein
MSFIDITMEQLIALHFPKDATIIAKDRDHLQLGLRLFQQVASKWAYGSVRFSAGKQRQTTTGPGR